MVEPTSYHAVRMTGISTGNPHPVILKSGKPSMVRVVHHWTRCDACSEFQLINAEDLKAQWECPECHRTSIRKESPDVPECKGRTIGGEKFPHPPMPMKAIDAQAGRACHMTPRCMGKARRIS